MLHPSFPALPAAGPYPAGCKGLRGSRKGWGRGEVGGMSWQRDCRSLPFPGWCPQPRIGPLPPTPRSGTLPRTIPLVGFPLCPPPFLLEELVREGERQRRTGWAAVSRSQPCPQPGMTAQRLRVSPGSISRMAGCIPPSTGSFPPAIPPSLHPSPHPVPSLRPSSPPPSPSLLPFTPLPHPALPSLHPPFRSSLLSIHPFPPSFQSPPPPPHPSCPTPDGRGAPFVG